MAKASKTTKKAVASNKSTPSKAVAKKAVVKEPIAKKAAPAKKAVVAKATPAKKAVVAKAAPAKKAVVAKAAPAKKTVVAKAAPAKKAVVAKATPAKKAVVAKVAPAKKAVVAKAAPAKKAVVAKAAPAKKAVVAKATPAKKEAVVKKDSTKEKKATEKVAKVAVKKVAVKKAASKRKAAVNKIKPIKEIEIVDAIAKKSDLKRAKPGMIAVRDLDRGQNKKKNAEEEELEDFDPSKTSILNETDYNGPAYRYSEEDLNEFKDLILKRLNLARENLNYYQALMARKDDSGTDDTDNRFNAMEDGGGAMEREQLSQLAARQMQFIDHLEKAIVRIENKTYGVCRVTGKLIDKARLKAVPHATLSIEAKTSRR